MIGFKQIEFFDHTGIVALRKIGKPCASDTKALPPRIHARYGPLHYIGQMRCAP